MKEERPRLECIDYLRGLFALSVMAYHYSWPVSVPSFVQDVLLKFGVFAVPAFYVISGISFGYVYHDLRPSRAELLGFWIKRFFRLWPVYAIAVFATIAFRETWPEPARMVRNLTLTFGFLRPIDSIPAGGWSIGNEMVFYLAFPILIWVQRASRIGFGAVFAASVFVMGLYSFSYMSPAMLLKRQWATYINPMNQIAFFIAGMAIAQGVGRVRLSAFHTRIALELCGAVFLLYPVWGFEVEYVTGFTRFILSAAMVGVCAAISLGTIRVPASLAKLLSLLGALSYSIYLLHVPVQTFLFHFVPWLPESRELAAVTSFILTMAVSWSVYHFIEAPFIKLGRRVSSALAPRPAPVVARPQPELRRAC